MSVINTNITALIGQKNLGRSQNALQTSMERLSSGLRINSAKDDAAGQAIANRMTAQITGLAQAQRNANDGISLAQTAEGSLNQVNDNLQRIRELSVQAQNGTNSADDLQSIQEEINQRLSEIDRISEETNFNGVRVLAEDQGLQIQVGANDGETITVNLKEITSETLKVDDFDVTGARAMTSADVLAEANSAKSSGDSIAISGGETYTYVASGDVAEWQTSGGTAVEFADIEKAVADADTDVSVTLSSGSAVDTSDSAVNSYTIANDADGNKEVTDGTDALYRSVAEDGTITVDDRTALEGDGVTVSTDDPLATLDAALKTVDSLRSELGAVQNRFEDAITNLGTNETNLSAARSRIEDADYAVEVSEMTRAQILQQAGTSVLAQANQVPQSVLSLLG